jgi:hypothetical protein
MSTDQTSWIPQQPQFQERTENDVPCGFESRQVPGESYWLMNCAPVPGRDEQYNRCDLKVVQNARNELVPRKCEKRELQILTRVDVNKQDPKKVVVTPHVDVYSQQTPLPVPSNMVGYEYDPSNNYLPKSGGGNNRRSILCQFPTFVGEDKNNLYPCPNAAFGDTSRCKSHMDFELNTGGGVGSIPFSGGGDNEASVSTIPPLHHLDPYSQNSQMPIYSLPMSNTPIPPLSGGFPIGGDTGTVLPDSELYLREHAPKLSEAELRQFLTGLTQNNEGFQAVDSQQLTQLASSTASGPTEGIHFFVQNPLSTTQSEIDSRSGFPFSSRYYHFAHLDDKARRYLFRLSSLLAQLSAKYPRFSVQLFDANYDSIASLQAKVLAVIPRILDWEFLNANNLTVRKDFFRFNVFKDGKLASEGFFERFEEFRDLKDNKGELMMDDYIRAYAFGPRALVFKHPDFTLFRPAEQNDRKQYVTTLRGVYEDLRDMSFKDAVVPGSTPSSLRETKLGSSTMLQHIEFDWVNRFDGAPTSTADDEIQKILTECILTLLCRLQFLGWLVNTNGNNLLTYDPKQFKFADQTLFDYVIKFSKAPPGGNPLIRATQFIIDWEQKQGVAFPKPPALSLSSLIEQRTTGSIFGNPPPAQTAPPVTPAELPATFTLAKTDFTPKGELNLATFKGLSDQKQPTPAPTPMNYGGFKPFSYKKQQVPGSSSSSLSGGKGGLAGFTLSKPYSMVTKQTNTGIKYQFPSYLMGGAAFASKNNKTNSSTKKKGGTSLLKKKVRIGGCAGGVCDDKNNIDV